MQVSNTAKEGWKDIRRSQKRPGQRRGAQWLNDMPQRMTGAKMQPFESLSAEGPLTFAGFPCRTGTGTMPWCFPLSLLLDE